MCAFHSTSIALAVLWLVMTSSSLSPKLQRYFKIPKNQQRSLWSTC
ncbi:MAG: hypothetical protein ACYTXT_42510 [Nostoc sp.]